MGSLCIEVEHSDQILELWRCRVSLVQQILVQVIFEVEFSDFGLWVKLNILILLIISASDILEK